MVVKFLSMLKDARLFTVKNYKKGDVVFKNRFTCDEVCFINEGMIKVTHPSYKSNLFDSYLLGKHHAYGCFLCFSNTNEYVGDAVALYPTQVIIFKREKFLEALTNQDFLIYYLSLTSNMARDIHRQTKILYFKDVRDRILCLINIHYNENHTATFYFNSIDLLASYLDTTREILLDTLYSMRLEGILTYNINSITMIFVA